MKTLFKFLLFLFSLTFAAAAPAAVNSELHVTVQSDDPQMKYREGQQAGFSVFEVSGWEGKTEIEAFFQDTNTPLAITDMSTFV